MKRPSDQAKLLFLGLLRTVSALAATERVTPLRSLSSGNTLLPITLRLARRTDVPAIQTCNLATLPENYQESFYQNHLRQWPELALVATIEDSWLSSAPRSQPVDASSTVVAYVLGKVDERIEPDNRWEDPNYYNYNANNEYRVERIGHVTSLAVLEPYRRQGLARDLMAQLHLHLRHCYNVDAVGLHVRSSNTAGNRLYEAFGYTANDVIPAYYQDGEDAYFMKKILSDQELDEGWKRTRWSWRQSTPRVWEQPDSAFRLPRRVGKATEEEPHEELLTGTM